MPQTTPYPKRLIEVDLPIKRISAHARREKSIRHGHISTLHIWWARRPLAACRAVICAALWPDPADKLCPQVFVDTAKDLMLNWAKNHLQKASADSLKRLTTINKNPEFLDNPYELRRVLLDFIADFANWDNSTDKDYLETIRILTQTAHEVLGGIPGTKPLVVDSFAGGGAIPLEALRVGADAIFACLGPALEIFSRYSSVEKASGELVTLKEYLEYVWAAVSREALSMIFSDADATGFEEDARLTAMWLWTLSTGVANGESGVEATEEETDDDDEESSSKSSKVSGYVLEFDAARKIAQGLGAHLENLSNLIEVKGDKARLLPVSERTRYLFGKEEAKAPVKRKNKSGAKQLSLFETLGSAEEEDEDWGEKNVPQLGNTVLDCIHQSMILFAAGRSEALKRFLVDEGAGSDQRFWRLAQALSALYPNGTDEKRWVDGVLARKKGLGF